MGGGGGGYTVRTYLDVNVEAHIMDEMLDDVVEMRAMDHLHTHTHTHTHTQREREREREKESICVEDGEQATKDMEDGGITMSDLCAFISVHIAHRFSLVYTCTYVCMCMCICIERTLCNALSPSSSIISPW